ncbi:jg890 [Pararge aegeria aegeria]|uniref:Jg890 protein n=1 Tax=Pararge aegeria aegeria TaxID=348720 RepID=A0A8S4RKD4_9NEOP|nr:jg890 [Pararge aegeria aegeria]
MSGTGRARWRLLEKKENKRCGSACARLTFHARAEGGSIDSNLKRGYGRRALSQLTTSVPFARTFLSESRSVRISVFQKSRSFFKTTHYNGHLRPVQARRALQDRSWKEQVRFQVNVVRFSDAGML